MSNMGQWVPSVSQNPVNLSDVGSIIGSNHYGVESG
jgi:hypothetical protein